GGDVGRSELAVLVGETDTAVEPLSARRRRCRPLDVGKAPYFAAQRDNVRTGTPDSAAIRVQGTPSSCWRSRASLTSGALCAMTTTSPGSGLGTGIGGSLRRDCHRFRRPRWQVAIQAGTGDPGLGYDLGDGVSGRAQVLGVGQLVRIHHGGPPDASALCGRYRSSVGGTLQGVCAFHLSEQRQ